MKVFVAVGEAQGFGVAARRLGLSDGGNAHHGGLEQELGVKLLQRTTRASRV